jgi:hypothetical protein
MYVHEIQGIFATVVDKIKGMLIKYSCLNKINLRLEPSEAAYSE